MAFTMVLFLGVKLGQLKCNAEAAIDMPTGD